MTASLIVGIILGTAGSLYVALPLLRGATVRLGGASRRAALHEKSVALQLLIDLAHDRQTGKLGEEDYEEQRAAGEARAIAAMKRLDLLDRSGRDDLLERLIAIERTKLEGRGRR